MVDTTWTNGGGDGKASTAANWSNGIDVGYNVIFDGTSTANCTFDSDIELGTFTIAAGYTGTITQSSDMHITGYSQAGGTFTGVTTKWVYCSGNFSQSGGTLTNYVTMLNFISDGVARNIGFLNTLKIDTNVTITTIWNVNIGMRLINNGTLVISSDHTVLLISQSYSYIYLNNGLITINGVFDFRLYYSDRTYPYSVGSVNGSGTLKLIGSPVGHTIAHTITTDVNFTGAILIENTEHATSTSTLNLNGHSLTATTITVGTRGVLANSAATDSVISCNNFDSSAGTFTEANTQVILNGNGTLKTGAHKFDELVQRDGVTTTLGSNITVTNEFDTAGSFINGAYSITHENPEKRLIAPMVNPIIRNPKRSPFLNNRFTKNIEIEVV